ALDPALQRGLELRTVRARIGEELDYLDLLARSGPLRRVDRLEVLVLDRPLSESGRRKSERQDQCGRGVHQFGGCHLLSSRSSRKRRARFFSASQAAGSFFQRFASGSLTLITALSILFSFKAARALSRSCAFVYGPRRTRCQMLLSGRVAVWICASRPASARRAFRLSASEA